VKYSKLDEIFCEGQEWLGQPDTFTLVTGSMWIARGRPKQTPRTELKGTPEFMECFTAPSWKDMTPYHIAVLCEAAMHRYCAKDPSSYHLFSPGTDQLEPHKGMRSYEAHNLTHEVMNSIAHPERGIVLILCPAPIEAPRSDHSSSNLRNILEYHSKVWASFIAKHTRDSTPPELKTLLGLCVVDARLGLPTPWIDCASTHEAVLSLGGRLLIDSKIDGVTKATVIALLSGLQRHALLNGEHIKSNGVWGAVLEARRASEFASDMRKVYGWQDLPLFAIFKSETTAYMMACFNALACDNVQYMPFP
jgi:hypothetical protein